MKKLVLTRYYESDVQTRGVLRVLDDEDKVVYTCYTLELPWKDNKNRESCIPTGEYNVDPRPAESSGSYDYDHYIVRDVPERSYILIHAGNLYSHTLGCILVGREFQDINDDGHPDVIYSGATLSEIREIIDERAKLTIRNAEELSAPAPVAEPDSLDVDTDTLSTPDEINV